MEKYNTKDQEKELEQVPTEIAFYLQQLQSLRVINAKLLDDGDEYMSRQLQQIIQIFKELIQDYEKTKYGE
ncbi:hypothetical protein PXD04_10325 [Methanosphaera sp. ISO3-F5]|uniref:hypothetical protein n=1 Tax=Methanosphaera sp. ISO3-F5 TaxID=1452353 RepID=UPI002B259930|nr:hypothetical protein [Methanosphaera sp. ISO3-F5]WQH64086.1 hypothetical protein PXD04_10325 [Methanosphaera sp. ISO3-F5]